MSALKTLRRLILAAGEQERCSIRHFLSGFDRRGAPFESKSLALFSLLQTAQNEQFTDTEIEHLVYGARQTAAFNRLVLRLRDKVLEAMSLDLNISRQENYPSHIATRIAIHKALGYAAFLEHRHLYDLAETILYPFLQQAEQNELFGEQILLLHQLGQLSAMRGDTKTQNRLLEQEQRCRSKLNLLGTAAQLDQLLNTGATPEHFTQIEQHHAELVGLETELESIRVKFILYACSATLAMHRNDSPTRLHLLRAQLHLLQKHPHLFTLFQKAKLLVHLSEQAIDNKQFTYALELVNQCRAIGNHFSRLTIRLNRSERYGLLLTNRLQELSTGLQHLSGSTGDQEGLYFRAAGSFLQGDFGQADKVMQKFRWKKLDQLGYGTGARLLFLLNTIDKGLVCKRSNLKQRIAGLLQDPQWMPALSPRGEVSKAILLQLAFFGFEFKHTYQQHRNLFHQLETPTLAWTLASGELIPIEKWFMARMTNQRFVL